MTSIGLLLGVSAAKLRNMDVSITTHLQSIHIPALLPPTSTELDVPHNVQVSAVLGIGLVFQDTGHRHDAEVCSLRSAQNHGLTEYYDQRLKNVPSVGVSGHQRGRHLSKSDPGYDLPEDQQQVYRRLAESSRHHVRPGLHSGQAHDYIIAGSCMTVGFHFAGSANSDAFDCL
ncbi:anaphase-promoting complex subunit 1-like isoform X5 [Oncorhynchus kisutch]|uniref:anaphase-promoting complex subunit 1-like isoform X5 n=1 Tax=Oncorhynchus kisutch TaxID=8019 RepID=UPI0012DFD485|nr:anaphase-promoting complex subunit 1-like isoform X5 [Oncorhynchus kisutch]